MQKEAKQHVKCCRAFTLVELILVVGTIGLVAGSLVGVVGNSYKDFRAGSERSTILQDGQAAIEQITRFVRGAKSFIEKSDNNDNTGYITFIDADGITKRIERSNSTTNELRYGEPGSLSTLTGNVTHLYIEAYDMPGNLTNSITSIRTLYFALTLKDAPFVFTGRVYLPSAIDSSPILRYKFDDNANDSSGNNYHGTEKNFPTTRYYEGKFGKALRFDGSNDYVAIGTLKYNARNYAGCSVTAWIRTHKTSDQIIASFDRSEYWRLEIDGAAAGPGQIGWGMSTWTDNKRAIIDFGTTTVLKVDEWYDVAAVFQKGKLIVYVDGTPESSIRNDSPMGTGVKRYGFVGVGSEAPTFNGTRGPLYYYDGDIDEFRIYDRALSKAEVIAIPLGWTEGALD